MKIPHDRSSVLRILRTDDRHGVFFCGSLRKKRLYIKITENHKKEEQPMVNYKRNMPILDPEGIL